MSNTGSGTKSLFSQKKEVRTNKGPARQKMPTVEKGRFAVFSKVTELDCARRGEDGRTPARGTVEGSVSLPQFPEAVPRFTRTATGFPRYPKVAYSCSKSL